MTKTLRETLEQTRRNYVERVIEEAGGNRTKAAKIAGMNRTSFLKWVSRYGLSRGTYRTTTDGD